MLYPIGTKSRIVISLDGTWKFKLINREEEKTFDPGKILKDYMPMAVPSSYNDLYQGKEFREHVGKMVYQREVVCQEQLLGNRLMVRFGSVTHKAEVYLNGELVVSHKGGFLPFEGEIQEMVEVGSNLLTVVADNIVDYTTLPVGRHFTEQTEGFEPKERNLPNFDFFNYSGIMRPVVLYTTPYEYIEDITVTAEADGNFGYEIAATSEENCSVKIADNNSNVVYQSDRLENRGKLENPQLWCCENPVLYNLEVTVGKDHYTQPFGFRTISVESNQLMLNHSPIYLKGFGKHEDFPVIGRGFNQGVNIKDISLMKWMGANSFRTSHYPYSEEMMDLCDQEGILVINEVPAVGLHTGFTAVGLLGGAPEGTWKTMKTAEHHAQVIRDLVSRDKNHPCVIMWSVANEPASEEEGAKEYFQPLCELCKDLDPQKRPVTIVTYEGSDPINCKVAELCDVLVINRYFGWYNYSGDLEAGGVALKSQLEAFHKRVPNVPIMLGEYGADAISGLHDINNAMFSEEFQVEFLREYHKVLDSLPYICGEHVWNFADFATAENTQRVGGNKKGVFTRERNPKMAAHYLKKRWTEERYIVGE